MYAFHIIIKIKILLILGSFFQVGHRNDFYTQNVFTMTTFRCTPTFVPKFAFLLVEIELRIPPQFQEFLRNWDFAQSHGTFFSGWVQRVIGTSTLFVMWCLLAYDFFVKNAVLVPQKYS
jgi:hypothetical protein